MTLDWSRSVVLTLAEFDLCWELLGLGEAPWQLDPRTPGGWTAQRRQTVTETIDGLARRGIGDARGPRPWLAEQLRLLADPELTLDVRFRDRALTAGVTARQGDSCALAVRHGPEIALLELPCDAAGPALVELLGPIAPGEGRAVTLPAEVLDAARAAAPADSDRFTEELTRRGTARPDAVGLVRMCRGADQHGQFGASGRSRQGRSHRAPYVIGMHRTPSGHYTQLRRHGTDGRAVVTVEPLSHESLLQHLDDLGSVAIRR